RSLSNSSCRASLPCDCWPRKAQKITKSNQSRAEAIFCIPVFFVPSCVSCGYWFLTQFLFNSLQLRFDLPIDFAKLRSHNTSARRHSLIGDNRTRGKVTNRVSQACDLCSQVLIIRRADMQGDLSHASREPQCIGNQFERNLWVMSQLAANDS